MDSTLDAGIPGQAHGGLDSLDTGRDAIARWCRECVADLLAMPVDAVDMTADFDRLGLDSAVAVALLVEVEERYGVDLAPEALYEKPNLDAVVSYLHEHSPRAGA